MFSGRHPLKPDKSGCYFIDRDGRHFHDILNYLRDGSFNYPLEGADFKFLLELKAEAEYYGLCGLVEKIERWTQGCKRTVFLVEALVRQHGFEILNEFFLN